jgi:DNA-binding response OmpR family regulator
VAAEPTTHVDTRRLPTVLIVDDEPTTRHSMRVYLKTCGYAAIEAATVERAVEALSNDISAAVLDVSLAGERSGLEVLSPLRLTPKLSDIPVLVLTGGFLTDEEEALVREQHAHVFYKPESYDAIVSTLDKLTGRPAAAAAAAPRQGQGDDIAKLREEFLAQIQIESSLLATSLSADFDVARARQILHRWAGVGGTLGFPDLSRRALALQPLLDQPLPAVVDQLRDGIDQIAHVMASASHTVARKPLPPEVVNGLVGKTVALVGLAPSDADWMARALDEVHASARILNLGDSAPLPRGRELCDVLVIDASLDWDAAGSGFAVLFFGSTQAVARWTPECQDAPLDFLVTPCDPEEFVLRVYRLASGPRAPRASAAAVADDRARILVADDDPTITALLKAALQNYDFECHIARDGGQALELAETLKPDALVLDLNMPHFDGFEVLAAIKHAPATAGVPVVLLSARQQEVDILRGFSLGADDYVVKPFSPVELVARVKRLLRKRTA